jgi:hypothetical protein
MKKIIALFLLIITACTTFAGNERLIGIWKSNKEATLAYLKVHTKLTPQQLDKIGTALGTTTITFDQTNLVMKSGDWKYATPYKIISETKNSVTAESKDPGSVKPTPTIYEFEGNSFWVADDRIPGYKERFDKLIKK